MSTPTQDIPEKDQMEEEIKEQGHPFWYMLCFMVVIPLTHRLVRQDPDCYPLVFIQEIMAVFFILIPCYRIINGLADSKMLGIVSHVNIYKKKRFGLYKVNVTLDNANAVDGWFKSLEFEQNEILSYTKVHDNLQIINKWFYVYQLGVIITGMALIGISTLFSKPIYNLCEQLGINQSIQ